MNRLLLSTTALSLALSMPAIADMAAANAFLDNEIAGLSVLSREEQEAEMQFFVDAAKPFEGMEIKVVSETITTHEYESQVLAPAFTAITGIKITHDLIGEGDVVLFHTGWTDGKLESAPKEWVSGEPGIVPEVAEWLAGLNVMAVGADTWGLDVVPPPAGAKVFYSHVVLLRDNGIYILETMNTGPLVRDGVTEFAFVLGQARIRGSVQMIINPVALY